MNEGSPYYFHFDQMPFKEKRAGVYLKTITGVKSQLCIIKLKSGTKTNHAHEEEQMGYILSGTVLLSIGDDIMELGPGDGYYIPRKIQHGFLVSETGDLEYIEVFCPPKRENDL